MSKYVCYQSTTTETYGRCDKMIKNIQSWVMVKVTYIINNNNNNNNNNNIFIIIIIIIIIINTLFILQKINQLNLNIKTTGINLHVQLIKYFKKC